MNPREALSLGSISEIVMPTDLRARPRPEPALLPAPLQAGPMVEPAARVPLMTIPARPIDPTKDRDRRLAESRDCVPREPAHLPRPPPRRVALALGALLRLRRHEASLIVCRGPIRKEAIDVFREMGMTQRRHPALGEGQHRLPARALARAAHHGPAPRPPGARLHRRDEGGARRADATRSSAICQRARLRLRLRRLRLHGRGRRVRARARGGRPHVHRPVLAHAGRAGAKDEAKRTALENEVSVTPGVNDATARTLLRKHPDRAALAQLAQGARARASPALARRRRRALADAGRAAARRLVPRSASISSRSTSSARRCVSRPSALLAEQPGPALPPEGDRRRRRQGPAHLRRRRAGAGAGRARSSPR